MFINAQRKNQKANIYEKKRIVVLFYPHIVPLCVIVDT